MSDEKAVPGEAPEEAPAEVSEHELALVKNIFVSFAKTIKTFTAYPKDNPIYRKFSADLLEKFEEYFQEREVLELDIEQISAMYRGKEVFQSDDRKSNIAFLLFVDGIRKISFQKGITLEEIVDFVDVLRITPKEENLEDDIVTLLWEKDLEHFTYYVPEHVGAEDQAMEHEMFPELSEAVEGAPSAAGEGTSGGAGASVGGGAPPAGGLILGNQYPDLPAQAMPNAPEVDLLRHEAQEQLSGENLLSSSLALFIELFSTETDQTALTDLSNKTAMAVDILVEHKNVRGLISLLRRIGTLRDRVSLPEQKEALEGVVTRMGEMEYLRALSHDSVEIDALGEYISLLNIDAVTNLIAFLGETENRKLRRMLLTALVPFASSSPESFLPALRDQRWFLVRNVVMVLGASKNPAAAKLLERVAAHKEDKVRLEVLRSFRNLASPDAIRPLKKMLDDTHHEVRLGALKLLMELGAPDLLQHLLGAVQHEDFHKKDMAEKRAFMEALGEVGKEDAVKTLAGLFGKKSLFHRDENAETRACAAHGLGAAGTPDAVKLIKAGVKNKNSIVSAACRQALERAGVSASGAD